MPVPKQYGHSCADDEFEAGEISVVGFSLSKALTTRKFLLLLFLETLMAVVELQIITFDLRDQ
jgi:hypothetical protein